MDFFAVIFKVITLVISPSDASGDAEGDAEGEDNASDDGLHIRGLKGSLKGQETEICDMSNGLRE